MANVELLLADAADLALGLLLAPTWGVYLDGAPVIQPASQLGAAVNSILQPITTIAALVGLPNIVPVAASTVEFSFAQDFPISTCPQEQGAFQSYDKVTLPFAVKVKLACQGNVSQRQAFLTACLAISASFALFDVVTPEITFTNVNCTHIDWDRSARRNATMLTVDLWFSEIPVNATAAFTNTAQPGESAPLALGNVQPQSPVGTVQSGLSGGAFQIY
jgi:hypothetical protein